MQQARLNFTPYGGSAMTLDVGLHIPRGMAEPDEVEMFPDVLHEMLDGSLARQIIGGRRNFEIVLAITYDALDRRKLTAWFLDEDATISCLAAAPTTFAGAIGGPTGSLVDSSTYLYKAATIDAVGYSAASAQVTWNVSDVDHKTAILTWDAMTNGRLYKIFRKKDSEAWKVLQYSTTNRYVDDGTVTPWISEDPPAAADVISYVQESSKMVSVFENGFQGSRRYSFRLKEAALMPGRNVFPV